MDSNALLGRIDRFQQRHRWAAFPVAVVKKYSDDRGVQLAALIAYYGFFSLFPLMLVFVTIVGFVVHGHPALQQRLITSALSQFPVIGERIGQHVHQLDGNVPALLLSLGGLLWSGLAVVGAAQHAMDEIWDVPRERRPAVRGRVLRGLAMLVVFGVAVAASGLLAGVGTTGGWLSPALKVVAVGGLFLLEFALFATAFRILTVADLGWRDVAAGAAIAATSWVLLLLLGSWYVDRQIRSATQVYGFFAVVIGLLAWIYVAAQVMLLAAEVNVVRARRLWPRSLAKPDRPLPADERVLAAEATKQRARSDERVSVSFESEPASPLGETSPSEGPPSARG